MNYTLSPMDRLAPTPVKAKQVKKQDIKEFLRAGPAILALQDEVERLNMALEDQIEIARIAVDMRDRIELRCAEMESRLAQEREWRNKQEDQSYRLNQAEGRIIRLEADLKTEVNNRDHFRGLVAQQDACINVAKQKVKEFLDAADREKKNAEHLARKTLELKSENNKLTDENARFKEQTTRLVEEKRVLEDKMGDLECMGCRTGEMGAYCGGCLGCKVRQLEHILDQESKNLGTRNTERDSLKAELKATLDSHEVNQRLVQSLSQQLNLCRKGLMAVVEAGIFSRKRVAQQTLKNANNL